MSRACAQCTGTDVEQQCADGQCYWEFMNEHERRAAPPREPEEVPHASRR